MKTSDVNLYTIRDKVAEESGEIFEAVNDGVAVRSYLRIFANNEYSNPDDYQLLKLGTYDKKAVAVFIKEEPEDITPSSESISVIRERKGENNA